MGITDYRLLHTCRSLLLCLDGVTRLVVDRGNSFLKAVEMMKEKNLFLEYIMCEYERHMIHKYTSAAYSDKRRILQDLSDKSQGEDNGGGRCKMSRECIQALPDKCMDTECMPNLPTHEERAGPSVPRNSLHRSQFVKMFGASNDTRQGNRCHDLTKDDRFVKWYFSQVRS